MIRFSACVYVCIVIVYSCIFQTAATILQILYALYISNMYLTYYTYTYCTFLECLAII